jgi:hypothetical protein
MIVLASSARGAVCSNFGLSAEAGAVGGADRLGFFEALARDAAEAADGVE